MANATEYATAINELTVSAGAAPLFADANSFGTGTNWYQQIMRDAFVTNHNVSVNGGTDKSKYNFSIGMLDQDGNVKGNNYKRYTARLTNDYTPFNAIKLGYNVSGLYSKSIDIPNSIFRQMYAAGPVLPVYYADGTYGDPNDYNLGGGNNFNPQATLDFYNQRSQNYRFTGNAYAELAFLKHFKIRTSFGGDIGQAESRNYTPVYTATLAQRNALSVLSVNRTETRNWIWENTLTYENTFAKDHRLTVLLGHTAQRYKSYSINGRAQNVPYNNGEADLYLNLGDINNRLVTDGGSLNTALSYFGRVNYAFKDKYLLNASIRQDGASQFYGNNVWGYFPSVGAGWVISNESFMKDQTIFDNLKLRASWGKVGNSGVPFNPTTLSVTQAAYLTAIFGGQPYTGASVNSVVPPTIFWERGVGTDVGLEASVLNNRLSFELDYYNRKTQQAIFAIPILTSVGTGSASIVGNQADFQNSGFEFSATWRGKAGSDFTYSVGGNIGYNKNKVLSVVTGANPIFAGGGGLANGALSTRTVLGSPIGEFYGYKVAGVFQTAADVAASAQASSAKPGDFRYVDQNGDNQIDGKDRISLGDPNPRYTFGLNTSFNYKNFDLAIDAQGVAGVSIYNANIAYRFGNENFSKDFYDNRWTGANSTNTYPSVNVGSTTNSAPNSFYVESGTYVRIRNIQLGYTLPSAWAKKAAMQRVRFFANAQNPINFFKYRGFSPEIGGAPLNAGIDNNVYPLYATYNFGVNVTF
jgi:TonB-linked SusC/RagA family outer membrane protein